MARISKCWSGSIAENDRSLLLPISPAFHEKHVNRFLRFGPGANRLVEVRCEGVEVWCGGETGPLSSCPRYHVPVFTHVIESPSIASLEYAVWICVVGMTRKSP